MDWNNLLSMLLGGGVIAGAVEVVARVRYRRQTDRQREAEAKIKEAEATDSAVETQMKQLTLAEDYKVKMLGLLQQVADMQGKGNVNQEEMKEMLGRLDTRTENVEISLADVVRYLNGDYQQWLANRGKDERCSRH